MIGVTQAEGVMTIELQRPERRNALNSQLVEELREAAVKACDGSTRVIILTGQGTVFCAGADLSGDAFAADYPDRLIELHRVLDATLIPVIGAVNGPAIGAGLQLAMQCDLRVVAPDAFFQFPTSKYGLALDNWSIRRLSSLVGHGRARSMLRPGAPRSPASHRSRCSTPSGYSTTTAPSRRPGRCTRNSSTRLGAVRTSSKPRWPASRSGRPIFKGPDKHAGGATTGRRYGIAGGWKLDGASAARRAGRSGR